jgi:cation/acetate symporter
LGIWWPRLTDVGAFAGLIVGGVLAFAAVLWSIVAGASAGWAGALLEQPAAWVVPITFAVMIGVSLASPRRVPRTVGQTMVRLHAPETLVAELREADRSSV